ncbi:hypothetical protein XM38_005080 [Halomicronema hongdechloris C2206]|uniref:Uncharacterized protein n=2 Tax=Halomicronema hongdechloris TaxID=1209493 RepID=A0A1Z3HH11_9CYAN|nr:hypothetical protein XM38_005080 [Halomicronema hongdechloris C2206]
MNGEGAAVDTIYGAVTTGADWKFLQLAGHSVYIDRSDYYIQGVDHIRFPSFRASAAPPGIQAVRAYLVASTLTLFPTASVLKFHS